ncbi:MAG TPA: tetratricopeptide repeat protein [Pyrinomonadaceae bacterium]|jgi:predicted Zn-dependent protease|nr:tetratricopeptide repeat protein [Pyrinomonadaceae bacterium]
MTASRLEMFQQMLASDPENTMVRFGLANEYLKAEEYAAAVAELETYLARADDEGAAYGMLARALQKIGREEEARAAYEQGIVAADAHGHPSMAEDYRMTLEEMD